MAKVLLIPPFFTKLSWSGDSEETFWSSIQAATCPFVFYKRRRLHTLPFLMLNVKQELCEYQFVIVVGLTRPGIELEFTVSIADALPARPLLILSNIVANRIVANWTKRFVSSDNIASRHFFFGQHTLQVLNLGSNVIRRFLFWSSISFNLKQGHKRPFKTFSFFAWSWFGARRHFVRPNRNVLKRAPVLGA